MPDRAQVTSVEALELFRAHLLVFLSKTRAALEEVTDEVMRTRVWLENEQRVHWEGEIKQRRRRLEQAQQELFSARISKLQEASAAQYLAFHRCQAALKDAEGKRDVVRKWDKELTNRAEPLVKQVEQLHSFLTIEMTRGVAYLNEIIKVLEAYAETGRALAPAPITSGVPSEGEGNMPGSPAPPPEDPSSNL
jgi:hypothetical protein